LGRGIGAGSTRRGRCPEGFAISNSIAPKYGSGNCQSFWANAKSVAITHAASVANATKRRMEHFPLKAWRVSGLRGG
jgi:hypothetical protein